MGAGGTIQNLFLHSAIAMLGRSLVGDCAQAQSVSVEGRTLFLQEHPLIHFNCSGTLDRNGQNNG